MPVHGDRSSIERVLAAVDAAGLRCVRRRPDDAMVQCPAHDDGRPSLHVSHEATGMGAAGGGGVKLKCFAGCDAADIVAALGLTLADLFDEPLPDKPSSAPRSAGRQPARKGPPQPLRPRRKLSDVDRYGPKVGGLDRVAEYVYCDADGVVLGRVVRLEQRHLRGVVKTFIQEHPTGQDAAAWAPGGWAPRGLYLLPVVVVAKRDRDPIVVCEGEKDVHTAVDAWGVTATTNPGGSGSWTQTCTEQLAGAGPVTTPVTCVVWRCTWSWRTGSAVSSCTCLRNATASRT
jgi:hypothetical protein